MDKQVFYRCPICGNLIEMIEDSGVNPVCCGSPMEKLTAGTVDASHEKHVPVIEQDGNKVIVKVGQIAHPMSEMHYIKWIYLRTTRGGYRRILHPDEKPEACFKLCADEEVLCAYEWCNLHGLWQACAGEKI